MIYKVKQIFSEKFWEEKLNNSKKRILKILYKLFFLFIKAIKNFYYDNCFMHTATLTYYSILSIVPIIAMAFAISKGFGLDSYLQDFVNNPKLQNKEIWQKIIEFATIWLSRTKGGLVAGVSIFVLLYSILSMIQNIEYSFNHIWKIKEPRTLIKKLTDYTTIILLFPIFLIVSFSLSIFIQSRVENAIDKINVIKNLGFLNIYLLKLLPFFIIALVFTFLYAIITNKKIKLKSSFYGGIFAGIIFQLFQNFYIYYQVKLTSYNAVYGSFAAIPFFFIWIYYSWSIILLGAEIAMLHENYSKYKNISHQYNLSFKQTKYYSILIIYELIKSFKSIENKGLTVEQLAFKIKLPFNNTNILIENLCKINLLNEIANNKNGQKLYNPAFDLQNYTLYNIITPLDNMTFEESNNFENNNNLELDINNEYNLILKKISEIDNLILTSSNNIHLSKII